MAQATQPYKRTMSGSIGAGMKSLFGNGGKEYYILEHKVSSKYHKRGEAQEIIIDEIELGRDAKCQVRFDESFPTVSRRHAAIIKEGDNWKLVQLSQVNSTYLNGHKIEKEWFLQNGDEIQLSTNGPKLGFIIPDGEKKKIGSIPLTRRLSLFRKQALRPYKQALSILSCILLLAIGGGTYALIKQSETIKFYSDTISQMKEKSAADSIRFIQLLSQADEERIRMEREIAIKNQEWEERIRRAEEEAIRRRIEAQGISALIQTQNIEKDVYFLYTEKVCYVENGNETIIPNFGWSGTGFLLNDGRFVTARHCVEGWLYNDPTEDNEQNRYILAALNRPGAKIVAHLKAISSLSRNRLSFTSEQFTINRNLDRVISIGNTDNGTSINWRFTYPAMEGWNEEMWATDWAYVRTSTSGDIQASSQLSRSLVIQQPLVILGFPVNLGVNDGPEQIQPIASEVKVSRGGLANNGCILHSSGTDHGNSGGPIFAIENNKLVVVGIVSRGDIRTQQHNWAIPICNIQQ